MGLPMEEHTTKEGEEPHIQPPLLQGQINLGATTTTAAANTTAAAAAITTSSSSSSSFSS